jgi:ABC-type multidrug transport system ATPase subunit
LPQRFGYFPDFTVKEFVEYVAWLREIPRSQIPEKAAEAIAAVDLADVTEVKLKKLSGGMLRRAGIACAIVNEPELLILDEPTTGLDPEQRASFRRLLRIHGTKGVVIVATHMVEDVIAACTEVAIMYGGRLVFRGLPAQLEQVGVPDALGDTPGEQGYTTILERVRNQTNDKNSSY